MNCEDCKHSTPVTYLKATVGYTCALQKAYTFRATCNLQQRFVPKQRK